MNADNINTPIEKENERDNESSDRHKRSSSYPAIDVIKAFEFATRINTQFSTVAEVTRSEIAKAFNLNAGTIIRDISSCVQYGFLAKNTSEGKYKLTKLFSDIFKPESKKEKKICLIKAFGTPKLYNELIAKLDNNVIPVEITNTLTKNHNITEKVSQYVADTFIESGKLVGVINENRFLQYSITLSTLEKTNQHIVSPGELNENTTSDNNESETKINFPSLSNKNDSKSINIPIHLTGHKVAIFSYPEDITENDIKIVKHQLEGVLLRINFEQEDKNKGAVAPS